MRTAGNGFTLLELLVVMALLAITVALVVPRLPARDSAALKNSARSVAALLRYLGDRAAGNKQRYRLHINLEENAIAVKRRLPDGGESPADDPLLRRTVIEGRIAIADVQTPRFGTISSGELQIDVGPMGVGELLTLHLKAPDGESFTVVSYPASGKVKLLAGYQDATL